MVAGVDMGRVVMYLFYSWSWGCGFQVLDEINKGIVVAVDYIVIRKVQGTISQTFWWPSQIIISGTLDS